jgi:cardiolipin synthase
MNFLSYRSLPNLITIGRLLLVPAIVFMIVTQRWTGAFVIFILAGISDALDGWIAKTFALQTELGAYLDPIADKALLVSIYLALAISGVVPAGITILVVARDLLIVGAFLLAWLLDRPIKIKPLWISKANTAAQIIFAALLLAVKAFGIQNGLWLDILRYSVAALTLASMAAYGGQWIRHMDL